MRIKLELEFRYHEKVQEVQRSVCRNRRNSTIVPYGNNVGIIIFTIMEYACIKQKKRITFSKNLNLSKI